VTPIRNSSAWTGPTHPLIHPPKTFVVKLRSSQQLSNCCRSEPTARLRVRTATEIGDYQNLSRQDLYLNTFAAATVCGSSTGPNHKVCFPGINFRVGDNSAIFELPAQELVLSEAADGRCIGIPFHEQDGDVILIEVRAD
jgi:hypothetical protein